MRKQMKKIKNFKKKKTQYTKRQENDKMDQTDNSINDNRRDKQCRNSRVIILSDPERPKFDEIQVQRAEPISLAEMNTSDKIDLAKVTLKKELRNICEIYSQGPICLGSGARLITKAANMDGVIADFEFDEKIEVDRSGNSNVIFGSVRTMRGLNGYGSAAYFSESKDVFLLENLKEYQSEELSLSFAIYVKKFAERDQDCPLIIKGNDDPLSRIHNRSPGIMLNQKTGVLSAFFSSTGPKDEEQAIFAKTFGRVKEGRWTHINVVFTKKDIRIYLNGLLDGYASFGKFTQIQSSDNFYIGGHPNYSKQCDGFKFGMSFLKILNRPLKIFEIQAGVGNPFGVVEPSYLHLGCYNCDYSEAQSKCIEGYHLCKVEELYSGVWQAAQIMGWNELSYKIFADGVKQSGKTKGMGICCRD